MARVLIIGGYGGFGARLARRLEGHELLLAGRRPERAAALVAALPDARVIGLDRSQVTANQLAAWSPDLVIDAAGPFQGLEHRVPSACIAAGVPYLDLADDRAFVTRIGALDEEARAAGVAVISGASSVPALSSAVALALGQGMARVERIDIRISASSAAAGSRAVTAAILSYAGKRVAGGRGGQGLRRERFALPGGPPLTRWVSRCDVPDVELLPALFPGEPVIDFRAGSDMAVQMGGLWLASWLVHWRLLRSLDGMLGPALALQRLVGPYASDRSAMSVTLSGDGEVRRWTLLADRGRGPEVPVMAAQLLAERILGGGEPAGARAACGLLKLCDFEPLFDALALRHGQG